MTQLLALALSLVALTVLQGAAQRPRRALEPIPFERVNVRDAVFAPRIETVRRVTLPANLARCEETGRIRNFAVAGGLVEGEHEGRLYNDSDLYKVLEGVAYTLAARPDEALEARADAIIAQVAAAQGEDGYLNTYYTLVEPEERWKNIAHGHELYCAGHLIEAAIAYRRATGKEELFDVAVRFADRIAREFGPEGRLDPPGHQELELALLALYRETGAERYRELARFFLEQRGSGAGREPWGPYNQDHLPIREQTEVVGHAVRATYQLCGMTDLYRETGDASLLATLEAVWEDLVRRRMYVTGGIGDSAQNEGFTRPFELPNDSAYAETCAAIGMALWNHRMALATGEARFAEVLEREVYNNVLSGVSLEGDRFFYDNPLASRGQHARSPWFDCSCCPTNVARFLPAMGGRVWASDGAGPWALLYVASSTSMELGGRRVELELETGYPWTGRVELTVRSEEPARFSVRLRAPEWLRSEVRPGDPRTLEDARAEHARLRDLVKSVRFSDGARLDRDHTFVVDGGWLVFEREWPGETRLAFDLPLAPRRVYADPRVAADRGRVALMLGPVVYCLEAVDHGGRARNLALPPDAELTLERRPELLGGVTVIRARGLARPEDPQAEPVPVDLTAIPYYAWAHRGKGEMVVWIPESPALAERPGEGERVVQNGAVLRASHCYAHDTLAALNDGLAPASSDDRSIPRHTFWDHRGGTEWLEQELLEPRTVSETAVYWFDDGARGSCRVPRAWRLLWRADGEEGWRPVAPLEGQAAGVARDAWSRLRFAPVEARALRLEVELQDGWSGGVLEWSLGGDG